MLANPATVFFAVEVVPDLASRGGLALLAGVGGSALDGIFGVRARVGEAVIFDHGGDEREKERMKE